MGWQGSDRKTRLFYFVTALAPILILALLYLATSLYRSQLLYDYIKAPGRGWSQTVHGFDARLGYAPLPGVNAEEIMPIGPPVGARFDDDGLRIPADAVTGTLQRPVVLALGCSFTYGAATAARDTYAYRVGRQLGGTTLNAGVCGYGLTQMVVRARDLIPRYKPDIVLVQYSDWLVTRAISGFSPAYFGRQPAPYYRRRQAADGLALNQQPALQMTPPAFTSVMFALPVDEFRYSAPGWADFLAFFAQVGWPLLLHDDVAMLYYRLAGLLGWSDAPVTDRAAVIRQAYAELDGLVRANGGRMLIVALGNDERPVDLSGNLFPAAVPVVDGQRVLLDALPVPDREHYRRHYNHWRGNLPELVDRHPNAVAHAMIAGALVSRIRQSTVRN